MLQTRKIPHPFSLGTQEGMEEPEGGEAIIEEWEKLTAGERRMKAQHHVSLCSSSVSILCPSNHDSVAGISMKPVPLPSGSDMISDNRVSAEI